jgi:pyruvate dehydrogenase E2 component (dihydrolipoamide acetyltransferase)
MYRFKFADIGEGIHEGILLEWMVDQGDDVKSGESLFLVETDKVNAEIPSPVDGKVAKMMAKVGDIIKVGDVIIEIDDGVDDKNSELQIEKIEKNNETKELPKEKGAGVVGEITVSNNVIPSFDNPEIKKTEKRKKILATPVARKMAKDLNVNINLVEGSGTNGRVMKEDIRAYHDSSKKEEVKTTAPDKNLINGNKGLIEEVKLSSVRKSISKAMTLSKQLIPHTVLMDEFDVSSLVSFRKEFKDEALIQGVKLTYMPFIIRAVTIVLKEFPIFNSVYDHENEKILLKKFYNIGVATDTPQGLMVPVIHRTEHRGILEIAREMNRLIEASRNKKLLLEDIQDCTFSITNYGALGALFGTPIIKHPQVAILGIGKISKKPVVLENGSIVPRDIMPISMAVDHRIIDGADAGRFVERLKELLSNPKLLLMS